MCHFLSEKLLFSQIVIARGRFRYSPRFDFHANEPRLYLIVPVVVLMVAILATYVPARRAARVDPMTALRQE